MSSPICTTSCSDWPWILSLGPNCFAIGFAIAGSRRRRPSRTAREALGSGPPSPLCRPAPPANQPNPHLPAPQVRTTTPRLLRDIVCRYALAHPALDGPNERRCHLSSPNGYRQLQLVEVGHPTFGAHSSMRSLELQPI